MLNSSDLQARLLRAQSLHQAGRAAEAWTVLGPLRKSIHQNGQALRLYTLVAQAVGQIDLATEALRRILTIERDPPEIIGALADMLGKAGLHDQAHLQWSRLVALQPAIADAHLNRAIAAADAGKPTVALEAADTGLKLFPGHARLLAVRAMALKNADRIDDALAAFRVAVQADPGRPLTRRNHALTLRAAGRLDQAVEEFGEAARLGLSGPDFHSEWAAAALASGRVSEARELYGAVLAASPDQDEAMRALTRLHIEYRTGEDPFGHYSALAESRADDPASWLHWANALAGNRRYAEAAAVAERALGRHPAHPLLNVVRTFSGGMSGEAGAAADELETLYRRNPDDDLLAGMISQIGLRAGRPQLAAEAAERLVASNLYHQTAWAILSLAWRQLDDPREGWLCDYDRLVMTVPVPSPDGTLSAGEYAREVARALRPLHTTLEAPGDQSLRHGTQTAGALFDNPDPAIQAFRLSVSEAAALAIAALPGDPAHPFLSRKATEFRFNGSWSVRLRAGGGHHVPHFHSEGWMSSAYYAHLPESAPGTDSREGWIEFGRPPPIFSLGFGPRRLVEPQEGLLVLFPSYMWHGTVPFGAGERLTAAFDYLPSNRER